MALAALASCAAHAPLRVREVDYHDFAAMIDSIYSHVGKYEVLFCVDADSTSKGWRVTQLTLPVQTADSVNVFSGACDGHIGDLHNHPTDLGGIYKGADGGASDTDFNSFKRTENLKFFTVWHGAGHWISYAK